MSPELWKINLVVRSQAENFTSSKLDNKYVSKHMTLIASFVTNGIPIIIGDLLVSNEIGVGDDDFSTPTIHNVNKHIKDRGLLRVSGITQKVLTTGKICMACAGGYYHARELISHIHNQCNEKNITSVQYNSILDNYPICDLKNINVISYFYDGKGFERRNIQTPIFELEGLDDVQVAGSGTPAFIQNIEQVINNGKAVGKHTNLDTTVGHALSFTSWAFCRQIMSGVGILEGWGGGFEIAYLNNGRFEKLNNLLFLLWKVNEKKNGDLIIQSMPLFIKSEYQGDILRIFVCDWGNDTLGERLYVANPLFQRDRSEPIQMPNLKYSWLINFFEYENAKGDHYAFNRIDRFDSHYRPVSIEITEDRYGIKYDNKFFKKLLRQLHKTKP